MLIRTIDDQSIANIGRWPWSRDKIAGLVDKSLGQYGAKALVFDMVDSEQHLNTVDDVVLVLGPSAAGDTDTQSTFECLYVYRNTYNVDSLFDLK